MTARYDPDRHQRRSIRLQGFDYSQAGSYFVTICSHQRQCLFGQIVDGNMVLNELGRIVNQCWQAIPEHFPSAGLDAWVIMPNHVHGIITLTADPQPASPLVRVQNFEPLPGHHPQNEYQHIIPRSLGSIVRGFKTGVTKWARENAVAHTVWHRNYYEVIVRDQQALQKIRQYIQHNPSQWQDDEWYVHEEKRP